MTRAPFVVVGGLAHWPSPLRTAYRHTPAQPLVGASGKKYGLCVNDVGGRRDIGVMTGPTTGGQNNEVWSRRVRVRMRGGTCRATVGRVSRGRVPRDVVLAHLPVEGGGPQSEDCGGPGGAV